MSQSAIQVSQLKVTFPGSDGFVAVDDVSFSIEPGTTLALIGASGSGKSVTSLALMGLLPRTATVKGTVQIAGSGKNLLDSAASDWTKIRGKEIGMVFQEPMSALNPIKTCGRQLMESILAHQKISTSEAKKLAINWLEKAKLPEPQKLFLRYPHQLSGGQKQRVMIAMAMCNHPKLLIADEPTTALDVTVQREIITLMQQLQQEYQTAMLFITHDLALANMLTGHFMVMEKGRVVDKPDWKGILETVKVEKAMESEVLLSVNELKVYYPEKHNWLGKTVSEFKAVDNVSFDIYKGETLGLVGESGCGKSTLSRALLGLQKPTAGAIIYKGQDIAGFNKQQWRALRKDIQIIFQDPYSSLNPRIKTGDAIAEPIIVHNLAKGEAVKRRVRQLLDQVQLPAGAEDKYPHEFSGGQRQRICIARALAVEPQLIICDESVSALDVKIQAQILQLLEQLQQSHNLTYLFITHDLHVVRHISDRIMVMQKGMIVESGFTQAVMDYPQQDYTKRLLAATPGV